MKVIKRNGKLVNFNPTNITKRIKEQSKGLKVEADAVAIKVISQIKDNISTLDLDKLAIEQAAVSSTYHPDYSTLAARLFITLSNKYTPDTFYDSFVEINKSTNLLSEKFKAFVEEHRVTLNKIIRQERDFNHDYFGLKTLEKSYLIRNEKDEVIERPQYMWLRTAIEVTNYNIDEVKDTYNLLSLGYYTHATPTLFNSGTKYAQLSSCFLLGLKEDSIKGVYDTVSDCAAISKWAGGIGVHIHNVRATGSKIYSTNGFSTGIVPMLRVFNETARYVDQGGGKRKGSFAIYLEPWHLDILSFLELKKNHGKEEMRARDLFYALWIPDQFMRRVREGQDWYLFCPNKIKKEYGKNFSDVYGDDFDLMYNDAIDKNLWDEKISARELWEKIMVSQIETGTPYIGYKDKVNQANNQKNYGVIKSSNLCIEINEYSDDKEQAVCNLASIALPKFVQTKEDKVYFDYKGFKTVVRRAIRNLDNVIDANYYPTTETKTSNMKHRPVGLGVQGLADVFALMKISFDSPEARVLNKKIFEHMYFYALEASNELSIERGYYETFKSSPAAIGELQFDLWNNDIELDSKLPWSRLARKIVEGGLRNSLLIALMPTASTSQILGNNECFEPYSSNMSTRRTLSGEFIIVNKHLIKDLEELGLWSVEMRNNIMQSNGSVQSIEAIPKELRKRYKTAYEISMKSVIDMAADRQRFICQAQSMNLFMTNIDIGKLTSMHFYAFDKGLKTGIYYLRSKSAVDAIKFTLSTPIKTTDESIDALEYRMMIEKSKQASNLDEDCLMCGS